MPTVFRKNVHGCRGCGLPRRGSIETWNGRKARILGFRRQEAAGRRIQTGCGRDRSGRRHAVAARGELRRRTDIHPRPWRQCRCDTRMGLEVRGACRADHPVGSGIHGIRFRRIHRWGQSRLHIPGDGSAQDSPSRIRFRSSPYEGRDGSGMQGTQARMGEKDHNGPRRGGCRHA